MIKINNLYFDFPNRFSLSIDNLLVESGKILAISGPNGVGKTTLLNIIALLERPKSGDLEILGMRLDSLNRQERLKLRRQISFVFPHPHLFRGTVCDNIFLPLKLRGLKNNGKVEQYCEFFKITRFINCNAATLSEGEKHRVALARAFITEPKLILLDEPFLSLDQNYKEELLNNLRQAIKISKASAVLVTHNQNEVKALADFTIVMEKGRIVR